MSLTYADFVADVIEELGVDGNRRGIETQRTRWIKDAVIDLQRFIRAYRVAQKTTYQVADLTEIGYAHLGTLPAQAKPKAFYIISEVPDSDGNLPDINIERNRLDFVPWDQRLDRMVRLGGVQSCDGEEPGARQYLYAISPFSTQFLIHPQLNDETYLLMIWDGLKMDFLDADVVTWPEQAAEAVASYVRWKILRFVDKRLDLARDEYGAYGLKRLALWREQDEAQCTSGKDEEYDATAVAP